MTIATERTKPTDLEHRSQAVESWATADGWRVQRLLTSRFGERGQDLFMDGVEALFSSNAPSVLEILADESPARLKRMGEWVITHANNGAAAASHSNRKESIERSHDLFGDPIEVDRSADNDTETDALRTLERRRLTEIMLRVKSPRAIRAMFMYVEDDYSYAQIGRRLGVSKQRAAALVQSALKQMHFSWLALNAGKFCHEYETQLAQVLWRVDALSDQERGRVSAHLEHCASCRATIASQRQAISASRAFFPAPAIGLLAHISSSLLGYVKTFWISLTGRAQEASIGAQSTAAGGGWQAARPGALLLAIAALAAGGGGVATLHHEHKAPKQPAATMPTRLLDTLDTPPVRDVKPTKRRKRKHSTSSIPAATPAPPPTRTITPARAGTGDGSSEFLPEAR